MKTTRVLCIVAIFLLSGPVIAANLIVNGSFEDGDYSGGAWETVSPGDTDITSWVVGGAGVDWHNTIEMKFPHDGNLAVDLNLSGGGLPDTGTLSQNFPTVTGQRYLLSFFLAGPDGGGFPDPREVQVDIAGVAQVFSTPASLHDDLVWERMTLEFTATGANTTVMFSSVDGTGYWGPLLDSISVEDVSPPPVAVIARVPTTGFVALSVLFGVILLSGLVGLRRTFL